MDLASGQRSIELASTVDPHRAGGVGSAHQQLLLNRDAGATYPRVASGVSSHCKRKLSRLRPVSHLLSLGQTAVQHERRKWAQAESLSVWEARAKQRRNVDKGTIVGEVGTARSNSIDVLDNSNADLWWLVGWLAVGWLVC